MRLHRHAILSLLSLVMLAGGASVAHADDCATFFWTGSQRAPVARYQPRYLLGHGLEDVGMGHIVGSRIRYKWSTQAASCLAAANPNGYFFHPDFNRSVCFFGELCFPGYRVKRMSERLADTANVIAQLATPSSDPTYQANLNTARAATHLVVDAIGAAPTTTASLYEGFVLAYDQFIAQLDTVLNTAMPPDARTAVLDAMCAPDNVARMTELETACLDRGEACELTFVYLTIDMCLGYQDGATLADVLEQVTMTRGFMVGERDRLADEVAAINSLWSTLNGPRGTLPPLPATCNVRFSFGTAQLPQSSFSGRPPTYGADLRYLYGDWQWSTFGVNTSTIKASRYVQDIIGLVRDCIGDLRYGRLDFRRRQVTPTGEPTRFETDAEYYVRVLDDVVSIHRQFAEIENNYEALIGNHAPLVPASEVGVLKTAVSNTWLRTRDLLANRTTGIGWVILLMQDFTDVAERFTAANELSRRLIVAHQGQFPAVRNEVIDYIISNTASVLGEYGEFFSQEKRDALAVLMAEVIAQTGNNDPTQVIENLTRLSNQLQVQFDALWDANQPLGLMASQLKYIFGDCRTSSAPHSLLTYFGDLPVTTRILEEGNDAPICNE
jgi:hypothetical protein